MARFPAAQENAAATGFVSAPIPYSAECLVSDVAAGALVLSVQQSGDAAVSDVPVGLVAAYDSDL
jgi:hypothetical protein